MRIVKILGGLGNQMFQYAFLLALKKTYPSEEIKIDTSCFRGYPKHNGFELGKIFRLEYEKAGFADLTRVAYPYFNYRLWQLGRRILPARKTMLREADSLNYCAEALHSERYKYFDGYWQDHRYFSGIENELREAFEFNPLGGEENCRLASLIGRGESASIHVRRGDYASNPLYAGICTPDYYRKGIERLLKDTTADLFCIFGDDGKWCKEYILPLLKDRDAVFVDWNKGSDSYLDMQLLSLCTHNLIANSSFSWWAAWLNRHAHKRVIGPRIWMNPGRRMNYPEEWTTV